MKKNFSAPGIEPVTSANMDNTWGMGMRSAGIWHLICLERSKTVQTISKLMDCNEIKGTLIKRKKKRTKNFYAPEIKTATSSYIK